MKTNVVQAWPRSGLEGFSEREEGERCGARVKEFDTRVGGMKGVQYKEGH